VAHLFSTDMILQNSFDPTVLRTVEQHPSNRSRRPSKRTPRSHP
jgi:hypothetical protein